MIEFYPQIKMLHIALVLLSGALFALRGGAALLGMRWPRHVTVRYTSYTIDTFLLTSAAMLATILPRALFANGWLTAKLVLLVGYVGLGTFALKRGRTPASRRNFYIAALLVYGFMISVARAHQPLGLFWRWL